MSTCVLAAPGPFEPEACVTQGGASARSLVISAVVVIVVVTAWAALVAVGVPAGAATFGLGGAAGLGLRVAARLTRSRGGRDA